MSYRGAMQRDPSLPWQWKSTARSRLSALFQFLRRCAALEHDRVRVCSSSSREEMNGQLVRENQGLGSTPVTAAQILQESMSGAPEMAGEVGARGTRGNERTLSSAVGSLPALGERSKGGNALHDPPFVVVLLLSCVVLFVSCGRGNATVPAPPPPTASPRPVVGVTHVTITITAQFQPATIQVPVGTTVTWTNNDNIGHTVTFRNGMKDSGVIVPGGGTFRYPFTSKGIFPYYCTLHPSMGGVVTVT